jgi:type II secretory pathway component PulC
MLRDDDSGKAFYLRWPRHLARQTGVQQANLSILRITVGLVNPIIWRTEKIRAPLSHAVQRLSNISATGPSMLWGDPHPVNLEQS